MNSIIKSAKLSNSWFKNNAILVTAVRNHWNKDYKPGPYPTTEAEKLAAAEKYGLHPSEYKPYPDDGKVVETTQTYHWFLGMPEIPFIHGITRSSKEISTSREDRYDVSAKLRRPMWFYYAQFLGVMFGTFFIYSLLENVKMFHPVVPRQYPGDGKKHYTFEKNQ
nr:unnamed protein product [Callosobruchus chinensis]